MWRMGRLIARFISITCLISSGGKSKEEQVACCLMEWNRGCILSWSRRDFATMSPEQLYTTINLKWTHEHGIAQRTLPVAVQKLGRFVRAVETARCQKSIDGAMAYQTKQLKSFSPSALGDLLLPSITQSHCRHSCKPSQASSVNGLVWCI